MKPNVLFILIDDLGCRDLGCFGSTFYETPNLDRLAARGMKFTNAYASCCVCSPTRASIMSGKYPARLSLTNYIGANDEGKLASVPYLHYLPLEEKSLASTLRENGYETWHIGKWHLGDEEFYPEHHGFDINIGGNHFGHPKNGYFSPYNLENITNGPEGEYLTDRLTSEAIELIKNRTGKPFFMNLNHYAVHTPIHAPECLIEKYRKKAKALSLDKAEAIIDGDYFPCLHKSDQKIQRRIIQSNIQYAAMIENLDSNVGRIINSLDSEGLLENTLIFFTSDNGGLSTAEGSPTCNLPFREGKGWGYEGGTRVCLFASWKGVIEPESICRENVISTDFYPTILDAAEIKQLPQQHCDGVSMYDLLLGRKKKLAREAIYWHYPHYGNQGGTPHSSIVLDKWKLIYPFETKESLLFNLETDPSETANVSSLEPEITSKLMKLVTDWQQEVEASIPKPNLDYEKNLKRPKIANNAHI